MLLSLKTPSKTSCFCMCLAAQIICLFIFLYCPMTQWGQIKKSESNDGKTESELLETGAWEGMVADTVAKKRKQKCVCWWNLRFQTCCNTTKTPSAHSCTTTHVGVSKYMQKNILNLGGDSGVIRGWFGVIRGMLGVIRVIREAWNAYVCNICLGTTEVFYNIRKGWGCPGARREF